MHADAPLWQFTASVDRTRARTLLSYPNFDSVASLLAHAAVEKFAWEAFSGSTLRGCHRASFLLRVRRVEYDAFFNAPVGYRGQFAVCAAAGEAANRRLLNQFEARLLAYGGGHRLVTQTAIRDSLRATQAKIWIFEAEVEAQLGDTTPAIIFAPWEQASESGVGLLAPVGTQLEIKGGWLAPERVERINLAKSGRSQDIHRTGFS